MAPKTLSTASNDASGTGRSSASPSRNSTSRPTATPACSGLAGWPGPFRPGSTRPSSPRAYAGPSSATGEPPCPPDAGPGITPMAAALTAGHGADDEVRLGAGGDGWRERIVGRLVGQVLLAGEKTDERPPRPAVMAADG